MSEKEWPTLGYSVHNRYAIKATRGEIYEAYKDDQLIELVDRRALATKDARIAELEGLLRERRETDGAVLFLNGEEKQWAAKVDSALASQHAEPCPDCGNVGISLCEALAATHSEEARDMVLAALSPENQRITPVEPLLAPEHPMAATPSKDGGEVREALDWLDDFVARCNGDDRGSCSSVNFLRDAVTQHSRIVAAKDAEIARIESQRKELALNLLNQTHDLQQVRELSVELRRLFTDATEQACKAARERDELQAAQPARHVGGDEQERFRAWILSKWPNTTFQVTLDTGRYVGWLEDAWLGWQARAALAPAAVVMPERPTYRNTMSSNHRSHTEGRQSMWDEVARLNRRAIPEGLLERIDRALEHARMFIQNGVALGFIRMPDNDTPDPAKDTLPTVKAAQNELRALLGKEG